jgi:hypothetical protein
MPEYSNFTSLPPEQEATFVVYERRTHEALQKSTMIGIIAGIAVFVLSAGIYFGVAPSVDRTAKDMDLNQLKKKSTKGETPEAPAEAK